MDSIFKEIEKDMEEFFKEMDKIIERMRGENKT